MPEITLEWLNTQAKQLVKKHWNIIDIPSIYLTTRQDTLTIEKKLDWDSFAGFYCNDIKTIALNNENNRRYTLRSIKRILLHELCHWRLHTTGEKWHDSDERFARELIRVGLGKRHNKDEQAVLAAKEAWKTKQNEYFEIYEMIDGDVLVSRMRHHRKNKEDFKRDLSQTLIKMHNTRCEDDSIYPADVADKMSDWYGYKIEPLAVFGINLSANSGVCVSDIGDRDDIAELLTKLDVDPRVIERELRDVASEDY